ncbi:ROK family protein [Humisphaera borealis]|uniref:ROK family protein n=1 Tax=Humisphaera borealis TaxID=2807512 RepID=A0A7M2X113_9BACT|nr:ROK family protein [Humisphaera borealis]QOV91359.1 ROK family protein [Humisphaera borealis]
MISLGIDIGGGSVKVAALRDDRVLWTAQSARYADPSAETIIGAIREVIAGREIEASNVGLCVPGILNEHQTKIALSVNLPKLNGLPLADIAAVALGRTPARLRIMNDTTAAAYDIYLGRKLSGRLFLMVLGTGVGVAVMDATGPLRVDGDSPGHFGQMDVSIEGAPVIGPDGGAGSFEGYIGAPALVKMYGGDANALNAMKITDPSARALARAVRIAHAMYRPDHVVLAGGVGIRLSRLRDDLHAAVSHKLTSIARPEWTLSFGENDFHNAAGAARAVSVGSALADGHS